MTIRLILAGREAIYFLREDWTRRFGLMGLGKFDFWRRVLAVVKDRVTAEASKMMQVM
jgi:hypothetical protein